MSSPPGEAASYETYKDIMDVVIEGWHGYKPTDSHHSDMDFNKLVMTPEQVTAATAPHHTLHATP